MELKIAELEDGADTRAFGLCRGKVMSCFSSSQQRGVLEGVQNKEVYFFLNIFLFCNQLRK